MKDITIFSGNANPVLAGKICEYLDMPIGGAKVKRFSDGEIQIEIDENIRSRDVFVIQSTCSPVNENLVELLLMIDACNRSSTSRITAVIPYYGYARQDKKVAPRVPISARLIADMITMAGADRVITMDLHAGQIQGFFNIPVDHLYAAPLILKYIRENFDNVVMVSPDAGGVERTRAFAKRLNVDLAIIDKRRERANECQAMHVIGDVAGKTAILLDDMVDTAGTLCGAAAKLKKRGASEVHACCSHPVLSGPAIERLNESCVKSLVVTNSIPLREEARQSKKITVLSVGELLGEAIRRIHSEDSVSYLFV